MAVVMFMGVVVVVVVVVVVMVVVVVVVRHHQQHNHTSNRGRLAGYSHWRSVQATGGACASLPASPHAAQGQ